jgi:hypothetical protein
MVGSSEDDDVKAAKAASLATAGGAGGGSSAHSSPRSKARLGQETGGETTGDDYEDDDDDSASGGSDEEDYNRTEGKAKGSSDAGAKRALSDPKKYQHHRREKRLAMNRESARARRKRKKLLIETLEEQVASLTDQNRRLSTTAETLLARIRHLESELALTSALGRPALPDASTHAMGPWTRDIGSIEASLLGTLPPAQQRQQPSSLLLEPIRAAQLRAEELHHAHRRAGLDMLAFHQGSGTAGGMDARLWEALPFRSQFLGDYQQHVGIMPTSMFTPSLQNTVRPPQSPQISERIGFITSASYFLPVVSYPSACLASRPRN